MLAGSLQYEETLARLRASRRPGACGLVHRRRPGAGRARRPRRRGGGGAAQAGAARRAAAALPAELRLAAARRDGAAHGRDDALPGLRRRAAARDGRRRAPLSSCSSALAPRTALAIPLVAHGRTVGALTLAWSESERAYDADLTERAEELASRAALAVANSRLYLDAQNAQSRLGLLARASDELASSLEYEQTLKGVAELAVPDFADWCVVDVLDGDRLERLALAHADPQKVAVAEELRGAYPVRRARRGAAQVVRDRRERAAADRRRAARRDGADERHLELLRTLDLGSYICAPMIARGVPLGALTFVAGSGRPPTARTTSRSPRSSPAAPRRRSTTRASTSRRTSAARRPARSPTSATASSSSTARGSLRLWNPRRRGDHGPRGRGRDPPPRRGGDPGLGLDRAADPRRLGSGRAGPRPETLPVELDGRELWLSIAGVAYPGGTVYAFRDLTEEHAHRAAEERLRLDDLARAAHAARGDLRRGADAPPRRHRARRATSGTGSSPSSRPSRTGSRASSTTSSTRAGSRPAR